MNPHTDLLDQAAELADAGKLHEAHVLVKEALQIDNRNIEAWYALTQLAETDAERRKAIYQLWSLDPNHPEANYLLDKLKAGTLPPLSNTVGFSSRKFQNAQKSGKRLEPKNYMAIAFGTLFAYWMFWIAGLGLNIYFLYEANKIENETNIKPKNVGCLQALLAFNLFGVGLMIVFIIFAVLNTV